MPTSSPMQVASSSALMCITLSTGTPVRSELRAGRQHRRYRSRPRWPCSEPAWSEWREQFVADYGSSLKHERLKSLFPESPWGMPEGFLFLRTRKFTNSYGFLQGTNCSRAFKWQEVPVLSSHP